MRIWVSCCTLKIEHNEIAETVSILCPPVVFDLKCARIVALKSHISYIFFARGITSITSGVLFDMCVRLKRCDNVRRRTRSPVGRENN